jgi:hypothetical protein
MPGRGPAPKPASRRARTNKDPVPARVLTFRRGIQPELPESVDWHPQTRQWWAIWSGSGGASELAKNFTDADWSFLLDTALMHNAMWSKGQWTLAAEVRLREAKFGQTPEDRARLRIVFADADEKDEKRTSRAVPASYKGLRAVD